MIKPFTHYLNENLVRKSLPNPSMARSLLQKAEIRFKMIKKNEIRQEEASIVFEEVYEALRESLQALMEIKGFKPYSHEAIVSFINEHNLLSKEKSIIIDNYRVLRNNSVYKAEKISTQKCEEALAFVENALPEIKIKFENLIKKP